MNFDVRATAALFDGHRSPPVDQCGAVPLRLCSESPIVNFLVATQLSRLRVPMKSSYSLHKEFMIRSRLTLSRSPGKWMTWFWDLQCQ